MPLTLAEIASILGTRPPLETERLVEGYSIDSRTLRPGELFFAVRGEHLDGHGYVMNVLNAGAAGAVVAESKLARFPSSAIPKLLPVGNTLEALQKLAAAVRQRWGGPVVAITGSTGKTTTRQMIAALLATRFRVLQSEKNLNNHFGLPLSLLRLQPDTEVGVFELGMSAAGEIRALAALARPDVAVVTNVSAVHLEFFPDVDAIARAKYELIEMLGPDAWAVLNADDSRVCRFGEQMAGRAVYFGVCQPAHFQAHNLAVQVDGSSTFTLAMQPPESVPLGFASGDKFAAQGSETSRADEIRFDLPLLGRHNVLNVLAALAVSYGFGIPPASLTRAVAALKPAAMRGEMFRLVNGALVVNDCYNSNPEALETMLTSVASLPARRRFAVLGDMMELGHTSAAVHYGAGRRVAELGFDGLFTVGDRARAFAAGAREAGLPVSAAAHFDSPEEAARFVRERLQDGDVVLLKASRAIRLEKIWQELAPLAIAPSRPSGSGG